MFIFTFSGTSIVCFVCDSASSELERWALFPFWDFPALTFFFVFLDFILETCYVFFRECWDFPWAFLSIFFCTLFWVSL